MIPQIIVAAIGIELMAAPALLGFGGPAADSYRIAGPILVAVGFVASFPITRRLRWLNLLPGTWLIFAAWALQHPADGFLNSVLAGGAAVILAALGRRELDTYGGGWRSLWARQRPS